MEGEVIGIAGVAIVTVREVFRYLQSKKQNGSAGQHASAGSKSVDFWDEKLARIVAACMDASVLPILRTQTAILDRMEGYNRDMFGMLKKMEK
jgi:hypothetical protein